MIDVMFPYCSGLDVHKKTVVACVLTPDDKGGGVQKQIKSFATTTAGLEALAAWLVQNGVTHVAMESTGVYWKPVYNVLAPEFAIWVVNAHHLKQVPGRKTDVKDAEWIAQLMRLGLLERSFIPDVEQRDLRDLTRYRTRLIQEKSAAANRLHKTLEDANIKLTSVLTDIQGVSARLMLEALIADEQDVPQIAELAKGRLRNKIPQLVEALTGQVRSHHRFMLQEVLTHLDELNARIHTLDQRIREATTPYEAIIERLDAIPGVNRRTVECILAEVGTDVAAFPSAKHLASWACLCPGNHMSANKRRSGKRRKGQKWLVSTLVEAAWAASRTHGTYLRAQFQRLAARQGGKRAAVAVAHSILVIVYHLLADPDATFQELGGDYFHKRNQEQEERRHVRSLESLGYTVTLSPAAA
jgi:transposase